VQRTKEGEDDYRYFPEPDLPPLVIDPAWIENVQSALPELPHEKLHRFTRDYQLSEYDAGVLVAERAVADYFEQVMTAINKQDMPEISPKMLVNWVTGELFSLLNQHNLSIEQTRITPQGLANLLQMIAQGEINQNTAKSVLAEMFQSGKPADEIVSEQGLTQISDGIFITGLVEQVLASNPQQVEEYVQGKDSLARWLFGQVMRMAKGRANPQILQKELDRQLAARRASDRQ
jgi:aspartyl-tRNA(Asn)/glutamyl-tRNA(Gln) amidotransferase subunit B